MIFSQILIESFNFKFFYESKIFLFIKSINFQSFLLMSPIKYIITAKNYNFSQLFV